MAIKQRVMSATGMSESRFTIREQTGLDWHASTSFLKTNFFGAIGLASAKIPGPVSAAEFQPSLETTSRVRKWSSLKREILTKDIPRASKNPLTAPGGNVEVERHRATMPSTSGG
jgi:hypothetical protein